MYIAGLELTMSSTQLTESLVWSSLALSHYRLFSQQRRAMIAANKDGGNIKRAPITLVGKLVTPVHALATMLQPALYLLAVPFLGFRQPGWMESWTLPDGGLNEFQKRTLRVGAGLCIWVLGEAGIRITRHLGRSFHAIGVREKPKIISTGPYRVVRHPLYSIALLVQLAYIPVTWSYFPIIGFILTVLSFVVKMPIEEALIESDGSVRDEYREYRKRVKYRVIPYIW